MVRIPPPGILAPYYEKELVKGLNLYLLNRTDDALPHFLAASAGDSCAAFFAAIYLAQKDGQERRAIGLLERILYGSAKFPTELMEKYLSETNIWIGITDNIQVTVRMDELAATLLLVKLYEDQGEFTKAISLLEEARTLANETAITLLLCHLLAKLQRWDQILAVAGETNTHDDITLEISILCGRAQLERNQHDRAISVLSEAIDNAKGRSPGLLHEARYWRAVAYDSDGDASLARSEFLVIYADLPDFRDVRARLIYR